MLVQNVSVEIERAKSALAKKEADKLSMVDNEEAKRLQALATRRTILADYGHTLAQLRNVRIEI